MIKKGYVYIMSNIKRNVLYIGITSNLPLRIYNHRSGTGSAFTAKYNCFDLLYFEVYDKITDAIRREKQLKNWNKDWKWDLIKKNNPDLEDISEEIWE